jgi:hypothetical protein
MAGAAGEGLLGDRGVEKVAITCALTARRFRALPTLPENVAFGAMPVASTGVSSWAWVELFTQGDDFASKAAPANSVSEVAAVEQKFNRSISDDFISSSAWVEE